MSYEKWLVVGGNRGIGLGLVKEIVESSETDRVIATTRNPDTSDLLKDLESKYPERIFIVQADFTDESKSTATISSIKEITPTLDHVIISAGIAEGRGPIDAVSANDLLQNFTVNVAGSHNAIKALHPLVEASKNAKRDITFMSTAASSVTITKANGERIARLFGTDKHPLGAYAISKTALNMLARFWALELEPKGIAIPSVHPGTVKTDAIDVPGAISTAESAKGFINVVKNVDIPQTDKGILSYDGKIIPW